MERYKEYRESDVEWLGEIPSHWKTVRISALYDPRNEKASAEDYTPLSVTMQGIVPQLDTAAKSQDTDNRKLVRNGDFVINSRSDRRGSCGIAHQDGTVSLISNVLAPKEQESFSPEYYGLLFKTEGFADEYYRWGTGIVDDLWSTNWSRMKNVLVTAPPIEEQKAIAEYISSRASAIDALIEETEKSINFLEEYRKSVISEAVTKGLDPDAPMKDSGIEWIGEVPEHWDIEVLGLRSAMLTPMRDKPEDLDGPIPWVRIEDYDGKYLSRSKAGYGVSQETIDEMNLKIYPVGTVLCTSSCDLGKAAIITEPLVSNQRFIGIIPGEDLTSDFLYYLMLSNSERLNILSTGTIQANLSRKSFEHLKLPFPDIEEQILIARFLDQQTSAIDELITNRKEIASLLADYRKSLISEVVTGKLKVPGVV